MYIMYQYFLVLDETCPKKPLIYDTTFFLNIKEVDLLKETIKNIISNECSFEATVQGNMLERREKIIDVLRISGVYVSHVL